MLLTKIPVLEHPAAMVREEIQRLQNQMNVRLYLSRCLNVEGPISCADIHPVYPPPSGEKPQDDLMKYYLDSLLEFMVTQVRFVLD